MTLATMAASASNVQIAIGVIIPSVSIRVAIIFGIRAWNDRVKHTTLPQMQTTTSSQIQRPALQQTQPTSSPRLDHTPTLRNSQTSGPPDGADDEIDSTPANRPPSRGTTDNERNGPGP